MINVILNNKKACGVQYPEKKANKILWLSKPHYIQIAYELPLKRLALLMKKKT